MKTNRIDMSARKPSIVSIEKKQELLAELEDLIINDMDAIIQLDNYCLNRSNMVDKRVRTALIAKGILNKDGSLPDTTNEAMYELRTGHEPFWLKNRRLF